jgi:hypothetical protein
MMQLAEFIIAVGFYSVIEGEINPQSEFFPDEAWFHLHGIINTQNNCYWSSQNPHLTHEVTLHPVKVGVWCAISARKIVGPMFFNETEEERVCGWFQQDSATAHTAHVYAGFG